MRELLESLGAAVEMAAHLLLPPLRRWRTRWGATEEDLRRKLPGDELVPRPRWSYTHAITIDAPASAVWPWLVQMGQGRAGFYSYEKLENLIGCQIRNAHRVEPELQQLRVGDLIRLHPKAPALRVSVLEIGSSLVLGGDPDPQGSRAIWGWHLFGEPGGATRLVERGRNDYQRGLVASLAFGPTLIEPVGFVMSRKMLLTIKELAEAHARESGSGRAS